MVLSVLHLEKGRRAYLTVEAAMVMPIVLSVILFLLYVFFFTYNQSLLRQDVASVMLKAALPEQEAQERQLLIPQQIQALYKEKYYGFELYDAAFEMKQEKLRVSCKGRLLFAGGERFETTALYEMALHHPVETLRAKRKMKKQNADSQ